MSKSSPLGAVVRGGLAGGVGVAVLDAVLYARYRREGGTDGVLEWEFGGKSRWDSISAPGQLGRQLYEGFTQRRLNARWARLTNNVMHWGYGVAWAVSYGVVAGTFRRPRLAAGPPFGALVWLTSYLVMPAAGLYKPIWEYDAMTLWKDFTPHVAYGTAVAAVFRLLSPRGR